MPQPNDLSRSLIASDQGCALIAVVVDDRRQPNRRERGRRQTLSGAHARQRPRLGARHRAPGRHRRARARRRSASARLAAADNFSERLRLHTGRRGRDSAAAVSRRARREPHDQLAHDTNLDHPRAGAPGGKALSDAQRKAAGEWVRLHALQPTHPRGTGSSNPTFGSL